jgi:PD-(D/E)XK nuclease superfamily
VNDHPDEIYVSITEILDFLRCRRAWDYLSPIRQSLTQRRAPQTQFHTGSLMHEGIEAKVKGLDPFEAMDRFMQEERESLRAAYAEQTGGNSMSETEMFRLSESYKMAVGMMKHYEQRYGDDPLLHEGVRWKYISAELSFKIDTGIVAKDDRKVYLVGTIDGVGVDEDDPTRLAVIEHKTYAQKPDLKHLTYDHQQLGYVMCLQQLVKAPVTGCLYDGIMKRIPQPPKLLQNGDFSQAMDQPVSYWSYKEALVRRYGVKPDPEIRRKYAPALQKLKLRDLQDQSPWFSRKFVAYPQSQLRQWWCNTMDVLTDMVNDPRIYYNRSWMGCYDCWVQDLCDAQSRGGNFEYVRDTEYQVGGYRPQYRRMLKITPENVSSVEDLLRLTKEAKEVTGTP